VDIEIMMLYKQHYLVTDIETGEINHCIRLRLTPTAYTIGFGRASLYKDAYIQAIEKSISELDKKPMKQLWITA